MTSQERIPQLNFLRGVAILMVIYQHVLATKVAELLGTSLVVDLGWIGVNLFFILSGFVLFRPYVMGERSFDTRISYLKFYRSRFWRLYPLFAFSVLVCLGFTSGLNWEHVRSGLLSLTTLSMFTADNFLPIINGLLWSLVVEIWFSIVFPGLIWLWRKIGMWRLVLFSLTVAFLVRVAGTFYSYPYLSINPVKDFFLGRIDDFVIGMLLAYIFYKLPSWMKSIERYWYLMGLVGLLSIVLACLLFELVERQRLPLLTLATMNNFLQVGFGLMVLLSLAAKGIWYKLFTIRWVRFSGAMCYSLYIWHMVLIANILSQYTIVSVIVYVLALFGISLITFRYIEYHKSSWDEILHVV